MVTSEGRRGASAAREEVPCPTWGVCLPSLTPACSPRWPPNRAPALATKEQKEETKEEEEESEAWPRWEVAVPSVWGRRWAGAAAALQRAPPRGAWGHTPGGQGTGEHGMWQASTRQPEGPGADSAWPRDQESLPARRGASPSCRATLGRCMGTASLRVREGHGMFPQRELTNHQRGRRQGGARSQPGRLLGSRALWARNPSDLGTGSGVSSCG